MCLELRLLVKRVQLCVFGTKVVSQEGSVVRVYGTKVVSQKGSVVCVWN